MSFWIARYFGRCHFFYSTSRNYVINDNEKKHASTIDSNDYNQIKIKNGENLAVAFHKTRSFVVAWLNCNTQFGGKFDQFQQISDVKNKPLRNR